MKIKRIALTIGALLTISTSGAVGADRAIDPYVDMGTHQVLDIKHESKQGERVEIAKDKAEVTLKGWNDEYAISVTPQIPSASLGATRADFDVQAKRSPLSKKMEYKSGNVTAFIEPRSDTEFDIDFILDKQPDTNVFTYVIEGAEDFDFFYQPELTQAEIDRGASRPENVVGSYAVYAKTKSNHKVGSINYATGKVMHIYRPKAIDADGVAQWAELNYENGILSVNVPQDFLDNANYPVVVDPTFGYTSQGASSQNIGSVDWNGTAAQLGSSITGTLTNVSAYVRRNSSNANVQLEIWSDTGTVPSARLDGSANIPITSASFTLQTASISEPLAGNYWAVVEGIYGGPGTQTYVAYDSGSGSGATALLSTTWTANSNRYSVYGTYTIAGSEQTFGNTGNNTSTQTNSTDRKYVYSATPSSSGTVVSGAARIWNTGSVSSNSRLVIYSDNAGSPDALLAYSNITVLPTGGSESEVAYTFDTSQTIDITGSTPYWIGVHFSDPGTGNINISRANVSSLVRSDPDTFSDGPSDPCSCSTSSNGGLDVYITYVESAGGGDSEESIISNIIFFE